jgi:accessory colonization factor AcfC
MEYTQKEIESNINRLKTVLYDLMIERKELNDKIVDIKSNIQFYNKLDRSQLKAF